MPVAALVLLLVGCVARESESVLASDGTSVFPARNGEGPAASVGFSQGDRSDSTDVFGLVQGGSVEASVRLTQLSAFAGRELLVHLSWTRPDGRLLSKKSIRRPCDGSPLVVETSMSADPRDRAPGAYKLRVYVFRELIAERGLVIAAAR